MRHLLDSDLELLIESGFVCLPLLFDPAIEGEIRTSPRPKTLMTVDGRYFIKTLRLHSLAENYERIDAQLYEQVRSMCLQTYSGMVDLSGISMSEKLRMILFQVMPHFIRRNRSLERRKLTEDEILDLVGEKISIPRKYYDKATKSLDTGSLRIILGELEERVPRIDPPGNGLMAARTLREWLVSAIEVRIMNGERERLRQALYHRRQFGETQRKYVAILLYIAEKGGVEIGNFGFSRMGMSDDYLVYKRTGEYALKDFYGRIYLFPDCRVAVSTIVPLKPLVLDTYKHPFLEGHDSGQHICLRHFSPGREFTAANAIKALEEGINALLYGYSSRRRNGYHSLDRITGYVRTLDFDDYIMPEHDDDPLIPTRPVRIVNFDDYRVSRDHPKIELGHVEITNDYTP